MDAGHFLEQLVHDMTERVAVWHTRFPPYVVARLQAYARLQPGVLAVQGASREKLHQFWTDGDEDVPFRTVTLFDEAFESVPNREQATAAIRCLTQHDPAAVVVAGYALPMMQAAAAWARRRGRPVVLMTDSTRGDRRRWHWKEWAKRQLVRRLYDCAFVAGARSAQYARELGFAEGLIWRGYDVVDNQHLHAGAEAARARCGKMRAELGLPDGYFLYVGRFSREKNLPTLLQAYDTYRRRGGPWELVLVGSGPLEKELCARADRQHAAGVHWAGARTYDELAAYYGLASCFVLPSVSETWGLVVNEAEAAGLPVLVSRRCGCVPELVRRGVNGYCFDPHDVAALARLMLRMSSGDVDLQAFGEASRRIVSVHTPETWARALADCVQTQLAMKR